MTSPKRLARIAGGLYLLMLRQVRPVGQRRDGEVLAEVVGDPGEQVPGRLGVWGLGREDGGELALTA